MEGKTNEILKKSNKGITLVALVITIILLLILAGITISSITNNNMIEKTQEAKEKTEIAGYAERLEISKSSVALDNRGDVELDKFIEQIYEDKIVPNGNITKIDEEKAKVVTEEGYVFVITGDVVEYVGKGAEGEENADKWKDDSENSGDEGGDKEDEKLPISAEGKIMISEPEWDASTHTAGVTITKIQEVDENLQIQYQINGTSEEKWVIGETATGIKHGQTIYARLWNGTKGGAYIEKKIIDGISPGVIVTITGTGTNTITATVEAGDNQSGLPSSPTYTFSIKEKEALDSTYKTEQSNSSTTCNFTNLKQNTEYTIKVTVKDNAENTGIGIVEGRTENVTISQEGNINVSAPTWDANTHTASVTLSKGTSVNASLKIQYQINGYAEGKWTEGTTVPGIKHNDTVYARLVDTTGQANGHASWKITDSIDPTAKISLDKTEITTEATATATIQLIDNQSGIDLANCKWELSKETSLGIEDVSRYTNSFDTTKGENQEITISSTEAGTYYLHVLVQDKAGRKIEVVSNVTIEITEAKIIQVLSEIAKPGDYVKYNTESDYDGLWQVLYNDSKYGFQIISSDCIGSYTMGSTTLSTAKTSYNNAVNNLNSYCAKYKNSVYATAYRSVGSNPTSPSDSALLGSVSTPDGEYSIGGYKQQDTNYTFDCNAMNNAKNQNEEGIIKVESGSYWLASRYDSTINATLGVSGTLGIRMVSVEGWAMSRNIINFGSKITDYGTESSRAIRPVITLRANVLTNSGDGCKEHPFELCEE